MLQTLSTRIAAGESQTLEFKAALGRYGVVTLHQPSNVDDAQVLTASGGLQEETTALGLPSLTLRHNTERPITVDEGTNTLVDTAPAAITQAVQAVLHGHGKQGQRPVLRDSRASERIVQQLEICLAS